MTRTAFLAALEQLLAPLPEAERKDALSYYEVMKIIWTPPGRKTRPSAIAELGSPEEVARKILDEQAPADSSAAPASPAHKPRSTLAHGAGRRAGSAGPMLASFFSSIPRPPRCSRSSPFLLPQKLPASSAEPAAESASTQPTVPVSTSDGLTFSLSAEMVHDKLSLKLDYGTVLFVVDPNASDITLQFDGFSDPVPSPIPAKKPGPQSFPTMFPNTTLSLIPTALCSPLPFRKISCMRWTLILPWYGGR